MIPIHLIETEASNCAGNGRPGTGVGEVGGGGPYASGLFHIGMGVCATAPVPGPYFPFEGLPLTGVTKPAHPC